MKTLKLKSYTPGEKLPESLENVLVETTDQLWHIGYWSKCRKQWRVPNGNIEAFVLRWAELPGTKGEK